MGAAPSLRPNRFERPGELAPNLTPPPGNPRFPLFDGLRAMAALIVFVAHSMLGTPGLPYWSLYTTAAEFSKWGVALFFLISGFLLYRPFLVARLRGEPLKLRDYARRRVLRIVPCYWVALTVLVLLGLVTGVTSANWFTFYSFRQVYNPWTIGQGIGVAWTLCVEVTFYAALPIFALVAARMGRGFRGDVVLLVILTAGSLLFRAQHHSFVEFATVSTLPGMFTWFAVGMGVAIVSVRDKRPKVAAWAARWPGTCWLIAAGGFVLLHYVGKIGTLTSDLVMFVLYAVTAMFILLPGVFDDVDRGLPRRILRHRWLVWIGLVSYAFYLYQPTVIQEVNKLTHDYVTVFVLSALLTAAVAALSYYIVERPVMRLGRRRKEVRAAPRPTGSLPAGGEVPVAAEDLASAGSARTNA